MHRRDDGSDADPAGVRIVDREGRRVGIKVDGTPASNGTGFEVRVTETVRELHQLEEGRLILPSRWVAGVRRDELRLSRAVTDPAFGAAVKSGDL